MPTFDDYIVFVDESGDHGLTSIDPNYPIFVLTFCLFRKSDYAESIIPAVTKFKWLKKVYWKENIVWSTGYFVSSVGVNESVIKRYVEHQGGTAPLFW